MIFSLELLVISVIFLSQESIRRACLRSEVVSSEGIHQDKLRTEVSKLINISWLIVPLGLFFTCMGYLLFLIYSKDLEPNLSTVYSRALILYSLFFFEF